MKETVEEVVYEEVPDARTIETGDSIKVKQVLDESAIEAVQEFGYEIDFRSDYNKIIIMFIACIFALVAQYYPLRFPQNRVLLGVCCVMYCILNSLLQYIVTFIDKDVIITTKSTEAHPDVIIIHASFPKYQEYYTVSVHSKKDSTKTSISKMYVGKYFTSKGEFEESTFHKDLRAAIERYEQGKFTTVEVNHKTD